MIGWIRHFLAAVFRPRHFRASASVHLVVSAITEIDAERLGTDPDHVPARRWYHEPQALTELTRRIEAIESGSK
jgi:hypothetical protein